MRRFGSGIALFLMLGCGAASVPNGFGGFTGGTGGGSTLGSASTSGASGATSAGGSVSTSGGGAGGGQGGGSTGGSDPDAGLPYGAIYIPPDAQLSGDPDGGYQALLNNGYVSCGVPWNTFELSSLVSPQSGELIATRVGKNASLPYAYTAAQSPSGGTVVNENCLACHAGHLLGQLVIGLGANDGNFTQNQATLVQSTLLIPSSPSDYSELLTFVDRVQALAPYTQEKTQGQNPADTLTGVLMDHRDPTTLAWSDSAILTLPPAEALPVKVPPWWRMAKKNAMFYTGLGRGDHSRFMMLASTLCTDTVAQAEAIWSYFPDIEAYITSLQPPAYPFPIDSALAAQGQTVFNQTCAQCHGTYGAGGQYPNYLIPTDVVGTDSTLAESQAGSAYTGDLIWFRTSFYGQTARAEPSMAYVAPPLDGIWAAAPYLHNGSVPTLASLLDSSTRPTYWTRTFDSNDYDSTHLGWNFTSVATGQSDPGNAAIATQLYDTTQFGSSNAGHTFGDVLSDSDRVAVLEYLKTL